MVWIGDWGESSIHADLAKATRSDASPSNIKNQKIARPPDRRSCGIHVNKASYKGHKLKKHRQKALDASKLAAEEVLGDAQAWTESNRDAALLPAALLEPISFPLPWVDPSLSFSLSLSPLPIFMDLKIFT